MIFTRTTREVYGKKKPIRIEPKRLEVVVATRVLMEDVHDHVAEIEKHPIPLGKPFDTRAACSVPELEVFFDASRDGGHLAIATPAHHDDIVGVVDLASYVDDLDSACLLVERCLGDFQRQLAAGLGIAD
jgi:hypothetical protein